MNQSGQKRILFVTGRLAEFALREVLAELAPRAGFIAEVAVLPISVAALMPPKWVARHLEVPRGVTEVIVPGFCLGDLDVVEEKAAGVPVRRGPKDLRDLPAYFGQHDSKQLRYGPQNIEIIAEINHAKMLDRRELLACAERFRTQGADRIDLGCDPDGPWAEVGDAVSALVDLGHRVSIDSFDESEVRDAARAGADLVLSVNSRNRHLAPEWGVEVVAIPDSLSDAASLDQTIEFLDRADVRFRADPILEPIGFGFAASLARYWNTRERYPHIEMMMGVGNLTELTEVDSAGVNMLLIGFCQELGIRSVLTTSVINWARTSVREIDVARRLAHYAVTERSLPKSVDSKLVMLRDAKVPRFGPEALAELAKRIKDPNWRILAEDGLLHVMNHAQFLSGVDPFEIFRMMEVRDPAHAFYLGYEMMKAKTTLTLGKSYHQDQALDWGLLTEAESRHRGDGESEPTTSDAPGTEEAADA